MPNLPTLAQTFYDAGYQTYAVGKLHIYPQRNRIGFGDVHLNEEGRHHLEKQSDDFEMFLAEEGYAGQEFTHAAPMTDYVAGVWQLPHYLHPTNWTTREMSKVIKRRDPTRPAFWYMSDNFPHPPLAPLAEYVAMYRDADIPDPYIGDWTRDFDKLPYDLKIRYDKWYAQNRKHEKRDGLNPLELKLARQAFYALCTHIDHQIRLVVGLLREEGILDNTILAFTSDHGDMLGNHGQYAKGLFYEDSAKIPFILVPTADYSQFGHHLVDDRLCELRDIMPTLLDMAGVPIPDTVEGISLLSDDKRRWLYGEFGEGESGKRMLRDERYKLIYYSVGNRVQLFDLLEDPNEMQNLAEDSGHTPVRTELTQKLMDHLYGDDLNWIKNGKLVGLPEKEYKPAPNRSLNAQRGWRFI